MTDVAHEIARFDTTLTIERAPTPPSSWYIDPELARREAETVFRRCWQFVGRTEQVAEPGQFFTGRFLGQPYLVTRDEEGVLRAFFNVCRHHAAEVMEGEGCAQQFSCPYHGWTYRLDGRLKSAPRLGAVKEFAREEYGLKPLSVCEWGPLIFVRFSEEGGALDLSALGDLRLGGLKYAARKSYELGCNWKVYVDNYLDGGYHVEYLHKGLASQLDLEGYQTTVQRPLVLQTCSSGTAAAEEGIDFSDRLGDGAVYAWLYPNFMLNRYGPILDTNWIVPLGVDRCLTIFDYWFDESCDQEFIEKSLAASHQVQLEDVGICESVQRGLSSWGYDVGRYAPAVEMGEYAFHQWLAEDMGGRE